jgi:nitrous oxidase accessory protein
MERPGQIKSFLVFLICCVLWGSNYAGTLVVGKSKNYQSIKDALKHALPGDTILIYPGVYNEGLIHITQPLILKGVQFPVLDGVFKNEILSIESSRVVVEGFIFRNAGKSSYNDMAALRLSDCRYVEIKNNRFENSFFGIYAQHATACTIRGNYLVSNASDEISSGNGIHSWKCDSMQIIENTITGHRDGIYFEFVSNTIIKNNNSFKNVRYGLHFMFSSGNTFLHNTFNSNGAGVAVMYSKDIRMFENDFQNSKGAAAYGILMKDITDSDLSKNRFRFNTVAVYMEGSNRITIHKNELFRNGWALKIQASCMENVITANHFIGNSFDVSTNGDLVLSRFFKNYWDKYQGYDLNRDGIGDVPYRPVSLYSLIAEKNASSMLLYRSFIVTLMDLLEKMIPVFTPVDLKDDAPMIQPLNATI